MGHIVGKDVYRDLGKKIDGLNVKVPWNETFHAILKELYSLEEADLVVRMPSGLTTLEELQAYTKIDPTSLRKLLDGLCVKGLVVDIFLNNRYYYSPSPWVIGIFEFTMMRTDNNLDIKKISGLFQRYMDDENFFAVNFGGGKKGGKAMGIMRTVPYEESFESGEVVGDFVEVLDYEKATAIVESSDKFSLSYCSCRHEQFHNGTKQCDVPLETCASFGYSAEYLIRNGLGREVSKGEMLDNVVRSKELGLVLNSDNVQKNCQFMCHCCKCCCHVLLGVSRFGFPDIIVTSSFIVEVDEEKCVGCGVCVGVCGVEAIEVVEFEAVGTKKKGIRVDSSICLGCGVCVTRCKFGALRMVKRGQRVLHPGTTFEKAILKHLERGNLQDQLFTNPGSISQKVLRGVLGGFLRLSPVKRALMSDVLRSSFLSLMKRGATLQGKGWLTEL